MPKKKKSVSSQPKSNVNTKVSAEKSGDENIFFRANQFLGKYKTIIEFIGAIVAIIVLVVTYWSFKVSRDSLEFAKQEFYAINTPTWKFEINPDGETIRILSSNADYIVQNAQVIYPDNELNMPFINDVVPPLHEWHVSLLKKKLQNVQAEILTKMGKGQETLSDPLYIVPIGRWYYPVAIIVNYAHLGRSFYSSGLYLVQYEYGGKLPELNNQTFDPESITISFNGVDIYQTIDTNNPEIILKAVSDLRLQIQAAENNPSVVIGTTP